MISKSQDGEEFVLEVLDVSDAPIWPIRGVLMDEGILVFVYMTDPNYGQIIKAVDYSNPDNIITLFRMVAEVSIRLDKIENGYLYYTMSSRSRMTGVPGSSLHTYSDRIRIDRPRTE